MNRSSKNAIVAHTLHTVIRVKINIGLLLSKSLACRDVGPQHDKGVFVSMSSFCMLIIVRIPYLKDSISYKPRKDIPDNDLELICVEILPPKAKSYFVVAWYRPPSDPVESFNKLELILSFLDKEEKEVILLGDTNCDFTVKECIALDSNARHLPNIYELFIFRQPITEPARITGNSSSVIDHIAKRPQGT